MAKKKPKAKKPAGYDSLSQKEKFIAAAKAADADESGETFVRTMTKIVPVALGKSRGGKEIA